MFNLIRRISYGVIPRPDRPWEDDPTSNAPRTRRKRRYSSTEREAGRDDEQANKKARGDNTTPSVADTDGPSVDSPSVPQRDTSEVKEVTKGVKEVHLDGRDPTEEPDPADREAAESIVLPESVPLPEEQSGELDQSDSDANPAPSPASAPLSPVNGVSEEAEAEDSDDIASSSEGNAVVTEEDKLQQKIEVKALDPPEQTIEHTTKD